MEDQNMDALLRNHLEKINEKINKLTSLVEKNGDVESQISEQVGPVELLFEKALEVKSIYARIHDLIHAYGMAITVQKIMNDGEKIVRTSLGPDNSKSEYDLVTDQRICEFKFSQWDDKSNDARKRQVAKDFVNLVLADEEEDLRERKRQLVFFRKTDAEKAKKFLQGEASIVKNINSNLKDKFESFLKKKKKKFEKMHQLYDAYCSETSDSTIEIISIETKKLENQ